MTARRQIASTGLTRKQVDEFELVNSQLARCHTEFQNLARGKGNDVLNAFKLSLLNGLLERAHSLLGSKYEAVPGFSQFESDQLPSISDALLVVSQYLGALEKLRTDSIEMNYGKWYWLIGGTLSEVRTGPPAKLAKD